jgi:hypothetical protein
MRALTIVSVALAKISAGVERINHEQALRLSEASPSPKTEPTCS